MVCIEHQRKRLSPTTTKAENRSRDYRRWLEERDSFRRLDVMIFSCPVELSVPKAEKQNGLGNKQHTALERSETDDENTVNRGVSETPSETGDQIGDHTPELPSDLLALASQLASLPTETRNSLATLLKTLGSVPAEQKKN